MGIRAKDGTRYGRKVVHIQFARRGDGERRTLEGEMRRRRMRSGRKHVRRYLGYEVG